MAQPSEFSQFVSTDQLQQTQQQQQQQAGLNHGLGVGVGSQLFQTVDNSAGQHGQPFLTPVSNQMLYNNMGMPNNYYDPNGMTYQDTLSGGQPLQQSGVGFVNPELYLSPPDLVMWQSFGFEEQQSLLRSAQAQVDSTLGFPTPQQHDPFGFQQPMQQQMQMQQPIQAQHIAGVQQDAQQPHQQQQQQYSAAPVGQAAAESSKGGQKKQAAAKKPEPKEEPKPKGPISWAAIARKPKPQPPAQPTVEQVQGSLGDMKLDANGNNWLSSSSSDWVPGGGAQQVPQQQQQRPPHAGGPPSGSSIPKNRKGPSKGGNPSGGGNGGGKSGQSNRPRRWNNNPRTDNKPMTIPKSALSCVQHEDTNYNPATFTFPYTNARFFVIKSYLEDDIHKSVKYNVWTSTPNGNKRLDKAFKESTGKCPVFLLYSVNGSGHFCGVAEMKSAVDFERCSGHWAQEKWKSEFEVKWLYVKDVPNNLFRHIRLANNDNKPVTNSRDTQEVPFEQGKQVLKLIHDHNSSSSIFDDFATYEKKEREKQRG